MTSVMTIIEYAQILGDPYPHFHPCYSDYWTTAYRWMYRYVKLLPEWAFGKIGGFVNTHKVWRKRYFYLDKFLPKWVRPILIKLCVHPFTFLKEELVWKKYSKYIEPHWGKYYIYPSKRYNNFNSMRPAETVENLDDSTASVQ
ncbi:hypothetical protein HW555_013118 [Spodoptera exigua]|uniref:Uncharacterized protein n=1 Tax=Spodoptera exigua TaxID=7107 RepID=A0A835G252_SPOEX|nr:hypothetical protein HW555_013118 [Spodoptera exigua]